MTDCVCDLRSSEAPRARPARSGARLRIGLVCLVLVCGARPCSAAEEGMPSVVPPPTAAEQWVREPYRVTLDLTFARDEGPLPREEEGRLRTRVETALALTFGPLWNLVPSTPPSAAPVNDPAAEPHKRFAIELRERGGRWSIRAREWDVATESWTEWAADRTADEERIGWCAAGLARRCFRPIALIDTFRGELRSLAFRGETRWPESVPPPSSHTLEIWLLYLNKERRIEKRQRAPWSYLVHERPPGAADPAAPAAAGDANGQAAAKETDPPAGTEAAAEVPAPPPEPKWRAVTGVRGSLGTRGSRVLAVGLAIAVPVPATELVLRPWKSTVRRIPGVDIVVTDRPELAVEGTESAAPLRLVSDRLGRVVLPVRGDRPEIRQLEVWSGKQVLARLPIVPGARPTDVLELPDDELRLRIEGDMAILQASIIDVVSRRAVVVASIRRDARANNWAGVDAGLKSLAELPRAEVFSGEVARIEGPALEEAKRDRDRPTQARIKRLCGDTRDMLGRFLSEEPVKLLRDEIADLRSATREQAEQVPPPEKPAAPAAKPPAAPAAPPAVAPAPAAPAVPSPARPERPKAL